MEGRRGKLDTLRCGVWKGGSWWQPSPVLAARVPSAACLCVQVDIVSRSGEKIPVSVWMKRVRQEHGLCCVVVLEPVERVSAWVAFQSDVSVSIPWPRTPVLPPARTSASALHGLAGKSRGV